MELVKLSEANETGEQHVLTTTKILAEHLGVRHDSVLRALENLRCSREFLLANFIPSTYLSPRNMRIKQYSVTRDGFTLLVMGLTGSELDPIKEKLIVAVQEKMHIAWFDAFYKSVTRKGQGQRVVYVIELSNQSIKIGVSKNPLKRFKTIQGHSGLSITRVHTTQPTPAFSRIESNCHKKFKQKNISGEFFKIKFEDAVDYVKELDISMSPAYTLGCSNNRVVGL